MSGVLFRRARPAAWLALAVWARAAGAAEDTAGVQVEWTVRDAVFSALAHNRALQVERRNPDLARTRETEAESAFDPVFTAGLAGERDWQAGEPGREQVSGGVGVERVWPAGTTVDGSVGMSHDRLAAEAETYALAGGLTVRQPLLRGRGREANWATVRQAQLDTGLSEMELRGFAEALVEQVESVYWDYALALKQTAIYEESLKLAGQQADEVAARIRVGGVAETELAAALAETARREEALINIRSQAAALQVRLWRLAWPEMLARPDRRLTPASMPDAPESGAAPAPAQHVAAALLGRPDLIQARLAAARGDLELVKTRNGLLPRLDLFVSLGGTGYADALSNLAGDWARKDYGVGAGLSLEWPAGRRGAEARHRRAEVTRAQLDEALANLEALIREDVEIAWLEVERARRQVEATAITRRHEEEKVRAETAKFRVGRSTALGVAQAQRDLVASQVAEAQAAAGVLKALAALYRADGTLLERRGIGMAGEALND